MPDEHDNEAHEDAVARAYTRLRKAGPQPIVIHEEEAAIWFEELQGRVNAALAEAAIARQETAAQSARIDRAVEIGQSTADRLSERIMGLTTRLETYITNADESGNAVLRRLERLEDAIRDLSAPKLAVPTRATNHSYKIQTLRSAADTLRSGRVVHSELVAIAGSLQNIASALATGQ